MSNAILKRAEAGVHADKVRGPYITTASKRKFYVLDAAPEDVFLEDIVHALSLQCRFSGHTKEHYSVLQHSYHVGSYIQNHWGALKNATLHGLLHDASEAYLVDLPRPLKKLVDFSPYRRIEKAVQEVIFKKFGVDGSQHEGIVKGVDNRLLATEARDLMGNPEWCHDMVKLDEKIIPKSPARVRTEFMDLWDKVYVASN